MTRAQTKRLTPAQERELARLSGAEQLTHGAHRARVQNGLVAHRLAKFIEVDGITVCRITELGREAWRTGTYARVATPDEGDEDLDLASDCRERLRSLRTQRDVAEFRVLQVHREIEDAERELAALEALEAKARP
jgi:hypothetical protein